MSTNINSPSTFLTKPLARSFSVESLDEISFARRTPINLPNQHTINWLLSVQSHLTGAHEDTRALRVLALSVNPDDCENPEVRNGIDNIAKCILHKPFSPSLPIQVTSLLRQLNNSPPIQPSTPWKSVQSPLSISKTPIRPTTPQKFIQSPLNEA